MEKGYVIFIRKKKYFVEIITGDSDCIPEKSLRPLCNGKTIISLQTLHLGAILEKLLSGQFSKTLYHTEVAFILRPKMTLSYTWNLTLWFPTSFLL